MIPYLKRSIREISDSTPGRVLIVGDKQLKNGTIQLVNELGDFDGVGQYAANSVPKTTVQFNSLLHELYGKRFIDILSVVCPTSSQCNLVTDDYKPVFSDSTHFTKEGAAYVWRRGADRLFSLTPQSD